MKVYRANISYMDGVMVLWGANKRKLQQHAASVCEQVEGTLLSLDARDIPTDRKGLVDWLNSHLGTDNG